MLRLRSRVLLLVLLTAYSFGAAPPTTLPRSATDFRTLELQAYQLILAGKLAEARQRLDVVYNATRPDARSRALVINHAILDLEGSAYAMRAVKDLLAFLTAHPEEDELATNVLGSCLDVASDKPGVRQSELWKAGCAEWQKRDADLEKSHGLHRWGAKWLTDQEFADLKAKIEASNQTLEVQDARVRDAYKQLDDATIRRNGADVHLPQLMLMMPTSSRELAHQSWTDTGPGFHSHTLSVAGVGSGTVAGTGLGTGSVTISEQGSVAVTIDASARPAEKEQLTKAVQKTQYDFNDQLKRRYELLHARPYPVWPTQYPPIPPFGMTTQPYSVPPAPAWQPANAAGAAVTR